MTKKEIDQQVAETILNQLGGKRFMLFTGAKSLCIIDNGLSFRLPAARSKDDKAVNHVQIKLNGLDYYDMTFGYIRAGKYTIRATAENIDCFTLQATFTENTKLYTHL